MPLLLGLKERKRKMRSERKRTRYPTLKISTPENLLQYIGSLLILIKES